MVVINTNIVDAVTLLDEKYPEWWKKINVDKLNMGDYQNCILGQLYGSYCTGLDKLNVRTNWQYEKPFCYFITEWKDLIISRLQQKEPSAMNFLDALKLAEKGEKKIRRKGWGNRSCYWSYSNGQLVWLYEGVMNNKVVDFIWSNTNDILRGDWEAVDIVPKVLLKDVKVGQKFYYKEFDSKYTYTMLEIDSSISCYKYTYSYGFQLGGTDSGDKEVIIVN
jgi:hypothetical protein